jgi:hypothetical protein
MSAKSIVVYARVPVRKRALTACVDFEIGVECQAHARAEEGMPEFMEELLGG